jgi:hypothetical protein
LIPSIRRAFNLAWLPEKYARFLQIVEGRSGVAPLFRHCETPCFLPRELVDRMAQYGAEMVEQLQNNPEYQRAATQAIPVQYRLPNEDRVPLFVQADFGLDQDFAPKLVEIQGFPSLYSYQPVLADAYREAYGIDASMAALPGGLTSEQYGALLKRAIVADHDPREVVLLEIDPWNQKTRADFAVTEKLLGIRTVDIRAVRKRGNKLYHDDTPIRRIYNRVIVDELERRRIEIPFDYRDDLDVEWAGHPNWYFRLSKFSLPYLRHPAVPQTEFLVGQAYSRFGEPWPVHPEDYVLKPLYSFAGLGVIVGPTQAQIDAVPHDQRHNYILQERVDFRPVIDTPAGPTKMEVRIMYIWLDTLLPVNIIIRMGRGAQMGVDHNKNLEWVGASAAFIV